MATKGIRVYLTSDQTGIADAMHTKIKFNAVPTLTPTGELYDTGLLDLDHVPEWDTTTFEWKPKITVPTIVKITSNISWTPPAFTHWTSGAAVTVGAIRSAGGALNIPLICVKAGTTGTDEPQGPGADGTAWWGPAIGYGKIWSHWQNAGLTVGHGEGDRDGPLSAANPRIAYADQRLCQPGEMMHMAVEFFSGGPHAIQAGQTDSQQETWNRSFLACCYEA